MKILHTSDWHLGKSLYDFSLLDDQRYILDVILNIIETQQIDAVIIAGDVYDRPVPSAQAVELYDYFLSNAVGRLGIPALAVAGNHDSASRLEFGSSLYAPSGYHVCGQVRAELRRVTLHDSHGPVDFWLLPYLQPSDVRSLFPEEPVKTFDSAYRLMLERGLSGFDSGRRNVAVAHGFFSSIGGRDDLPLLTSDSEINIGGMDIADSGCFSRFDYAALGHLHAPQRAGPEHIRYSGSPLKYSLSEERQRKGCTLVELGPDGVADITALPLEPLRDLRTVSGSLEQLIEPSYHENQSFSDYVFANLSDTGALYPMEKLRRLFPRMIGLRLSGMEERMPALTPAGGPRLSPEDMFTRFYREVRGHDMPEDSLAFLNETAALAAQKEADSL